MQARSADSALGHFEEICIIDLAQGEGPNRTLGQADNSSQLSLSLQVAISGICKAPDDLLAQ